MAIRGIRGRLTVTLVALVALTAILLGFGAYLFVETSLHDQALRDAAAQARFDLSTTVPDRGLPAEPTRADIIDSGLRQTFLQRDIDSIIDIGSGDPGRVTHRPRRCAADAAGRHAREGRHRRAGLRLDGDRRQAEPRRRRPGRGERSGLLLRP